MTVLRLAACTLPLVILTAGCLGPRVGERIPRMGDEILACGQLFHIGTPVVLWLDPHGYDAYRAERKFDYEKRPASAPATRPARRDPEFLPPRYGSLRRHIPAELAEQVTRRSWELTELQRHVDQFVLHYDVCGTSRQCFKVLHDLRGLSVHFMLDVDGTIYQTLDLKERAWHAGTANDRSIGIEIANIGAYPPDDKDRTLDKWYERDDRGRPFVKFPGWMKETGIRTTDFRAFPARPERIRGRIHGAEYEQHDFTNEQYHALARLTAGLTRVLPRVKLEFPREADGTVVQRLLTPEEQAAFSGVLGHFHVDKNKQDPGPALDWERLRRDTRQALAW